MIEIKDTNKKTVLGKGLSALLQDVDESPTSEGLVDVDQLCSGKFQPRRNFDNDSLVELAESIKHNGIIQPILVRRICDADGFEIIAGERRWRAAKMAGLSEVPIVVKDIDDKIALEFSIIENVQRSDLSPIEEAEGYNRLLNEFSCTQSDISVISGKSRSYVANMLRLLALSPKIKGLLDKGDVTVGHARALIKAKDADYIVDKIVELGMSVRETEELIRQCNALEGKDNSKSKVNNDKIKSKELLELELNLMQITGCSVKIKERGGSKGVLEIEYVDSVNLKNIIEKLVEGFCVES